MKRITPAFLNLTGFNAPLACCVSWALALLAGASLCGAESSLPPKFWPGYAILGNGHICAVYSDHPGGLSKSTLRGIQHLYYQNFTADYIASTSFQLLDESMHPIDREAPRADSVGMDNFYTALTISQISEELQVEVRAFSHPRDAIILTFTVKGTSTDYSYKFRARLLRRIVADEPILLDSTAIIAGGALCSWSNGTSLAVADLPGEARAAMDDMGLAIQGSLDENPVVLIIAAAESEHRALEKLEAIRRETNPVETAADHWRTWLNAGVIPEFGDDALLDAFCRNLYAAKAANLSGQIPADVTGQFLTDSMPQLYPRDALMCARVFLLTGHLEEARQVLSFWADARIPLKSPGEWYARYDAHGAAVDGGSGARYDEPEWDSNGYVIQLAETYHQKTGQWPVDPPFLFQLADFLTDRLDDNGLLYEGGIVEWTGYLPATNMIAAAALETASRIADDLGDSLREGRYREVARRIAASLDVMFDKNRSVYADVRFAGRKAADNRSLAEDSGEALRLWDTSANFGLVWGYPDHPEIQQSNQFYADHCVKDGGGMQYFDSPDPGLAGYGHDLFVFTTAAAAQYQAKHGDPARAKRHIDWMLANANVYGLMPERVYLNGSGCSQASPLSWCCAEFAAALLEWQSAR